MPNSIFFISFYRMRSHLISCGRKSNKLNRIMLFLGRATHKHTRTANNKHTNKWQHRKVKERLSNGARGTGERVGQRISLLRAKQRDGDLLLFFSFRLFSPHFYPFFLLLNIMHIPETMAFTHWNCPQLNGASFSLFSVPLLQLDL